MKVIKTIITELEFLKEEREKIKSILTECTHDDPHYYSVYLNVYRSLSEQIDKLTKVPDLRGSGPFRPYTYLDNK